MVKLGQRVSWLRNNGEPTSGRIIMVGNGTTSPAGDDPVLLVKCDDNVTRPLRVSKLSDDPAADGRLW